MDGLATIGIRGLLATMEEGDRFKGRKKTRPTADAKAPNLGLQNNTLYVRMGDAAALLGCSVTTLRRYADELEPVLDEQGGRWFPLRNILNAKRHSSRWARDLSADEITSECFRMLEEGVSPRQIVIELGNLSVVERCWNAWQRMAPKPVARPQSDPFWSDRVQPTRIPRWDPERDRHKLPTDAQILSMSPAERQRYTELTYTRGTPESEAWTRAYQPDVYARDMKKKREEAARQANAPQPSIKPTAEQNDRDKLNENVRQELARLKAQLAEKRAEQAPAEQPDPAIAEQLAMAGLDIATVKQWLRLAITPGTPEREEVEQRVGKQKWESLLLEFDLG